MMTFCQPRDYRRQFDPHLVYKVFCYRESDLAVGLPVGCWNERLVFQTDTLLRQLRTSLEAYIGRDPLFLTSHQPHTVQQDAPILAKEMAQAARLAGVGPMAAVAGAISQAVGRSLLRYSREVIVENGGDIYLAGAEEKTIGIFAGERSPFTGRVAIKLQDKLLPLGVCTSSGTVGPSISYGCADCATILAKDTALADAVATACGNRVRSTADLKTAVEFALSVPGVLGALACKDDQMVALGEIELTSLA